MGTVTIAEVIILLNDMRTLAGRLESDASASTRGYADVLHARQASVRGLDLRTVTEWVGVK